MSKITIFGRMWPHNGLSSMQSGQVRLSHHVYFYFFKSGLAKALVVLAGVFVIQACSLDTIRNSPGHRAMYYYDSIQDAAIRQHLQEQGYLEEGGLNDE